MLKEKKLTKEKILRIPKEPGVYFFYDKKKKLLYVGKSNNLKERIRDHFNQPTHRDTFFIKKVDKIGYIPLSSEIEALILESQLIKEKQPKFNIIFRDDKKYFYVGITYENWPRVFLTHQPQNKKEYIGPFTDGSSLKEALKILRKIFPFRSCKNLPKKSCLWYDINRCPAPCLIEKEKTIREKLQRQTKKRQTEYKRDIKKLKEVLEGKRKKTINRFKKEMKEFAEKEEFEKAAIIRNKIQSLERVFSHKIIFEKAEISSKLLNEGKLLKKSLSLKNIPKKIEGYDISNIRATQMVGAMVTFKLNSSGKYVPNKKEYRLFRIKTVKKQNDIACLGEIISRRLKHNEWEKPDLIYVDGGKAQLNIAVNSVKKAKKSIPVISLAKKTNILYTNILDSPVSLDKLEKAAKMTILRIKDESHRFAISYHKKLREKSLLGF